ncbi:aspartate carbamoyltransferase [Pseudomonas sp. MWU13-2100]|uniref:aspartate carbamoyltransferase n=1 Tax=Pseudomonas sp. MWU13-2100 TaxID=2935075 RepID=UPI00200E0696|nr:aspartate carbamoyltransferase [Pseudomonas sp. MWU13-2100]
MSPIAITLGLIAAVSGNAYAQTVDHTKMNHAAHMAAMADAQRQAAVSQRGEEVMPFSLAATTHIFTKSAEGGTQQVVAKDSANIEQVRLVREHLQEIRKQFLKGDFSGPSRIHGDDMPGLADLKATTPGQITIDYKEIEGGAELIYKTSNSLLVTALHQWFDAQLSDHGKDAMEGHTNHGDM